MTGMAVVEAVQDLQDQMAVHGMPTATTSSSPRRPPHRRPMAKCANVLRRTLWRWKWIRRLGTTRITTYVAIR